VRFVCAAQAVVLDCRRVTTSKEYERVFSLQMKIYYKSLRKVI
jgi:hypothetical protein